MERFYCPESNLSSSKIELTNLDEIHHLVRVKRINTNEKIILFNGKGREAIGILRSINKKSVSVEVISVTNNELKYPYLILACAIPKRSKFEIIIEKATELGVFEIIPLKSERTEINLKEERLEKKLKRFESVAINAAKQCQRATVPVIHPIMEFAEAIQYCKKNTQIFIPSLEVNKRTSLIQSLEKNKLAKQLSFFIGPEGDFTSKEYAYAEKEGAIAVGLGSTILKVETAALTALSGARLFYDL